jgi:hypothetical protein
VVTAGADTSAISGEDMAAFHDMLHTIVSAVILMQRVEGVQRALLGEEIE